MLRSLQAQLLARFGNSNPHQSKLQAPNHSAALRCWSSWERLAASLSSEWSRGFLRLSVLLVRFHFAGPTSVRASPDAEPALPAGAATSLDVAATTRVNAVVGATKRKTAREDYARLM
jgi:hypothetical protein